MDWIRSAKIAGAGTAFAGLIAWMVPPTTPKPPEQAAWRSAAKAHPSTMPQPDRLASTAEPAYPPPVVQTVATPHIRANTADADRSDRNENQPEPAVVIDHRYGNDDRRSDDDASDEDRYRSGYSWAADAQVQDLRECRRLRGDSGEDGCLDFVREHYDRDERERWVGN